MIRMDSITKMVFTTCFSSIIRTKQMGMMHWGHLTSKDLIKWDEQPIALYPDELGYIFSEVQWWM